jgi:hypothetical protein
MAYDASRGVTVLFGGWTYSLFNGETWEWNGTTWTLRATGGPSPRYGHAMAYDAARGVTVLFGGSLGGANDETWDWDGTAWTLRATGSPSPWYRHAMAYDAARGVTVLFGGRRDSQDFSGETWEWACSNPVSIAGHPSDLSLLPGETAVFSVRAGGPVSSYQWRRNGVNLSDGGRISGSATATLTITHVRLSDEGAYDCVVTGDCNRVASIAASLDVLCIADWNGDGVVDFNDFLAFMNDYNAGDPRADLNGDGTVDFNDFLAFINLFNAGC